MGFPFNVSTHVATGTIGVDDLALDAVAVKIAVVMCAAVRGLWWVLQTGMLLLVL